MGKDVINTMSMDGIRIRIENSLEVDSRRKDERGEVFTPFFLIVEMLSRLPLSVWKNPRLKWLDPANGIGGFMMVIYALLMQRLPDTYEGDSDARIPQYSTREEKSTHILKYMLYAYEINVDNVRISRQLFGKDANIIQGDFLLSTKDSTTKYDIIVGNPPYNVGGSVKGGGIVWRDFVYQALDMLMPHGYLLFVHPTGWRKPSTENVSSGDVWRLFQKCSLLFLKMSDVKIKNFPRVDYYVLQNTPHAENQKTHVVCQFESHAYEGDLYLYDLPFIPHYISPMVMRIIRKLLSHDKSDLHLDIKRSRDIEVSKADMKKKAGHIPHTFYYGPERKDYTYVYKKYDTAEIPEYIMKPKIIMTYTRGKEKGELYPVYYGTPMGASPNTMYLEIEPRRAKTMLTLLESTLVKFLLKITQYSEKPNYKNEYKVLNLIAMPDATVVLKTDEDVYRYYGLATNEIKWVNKVVHGSSGSVQKRTRRKAIRGRNASVATRKNGVR